MFVGSAFEAVACAVGNVTRLFSRNRYVAINCRTSWDQPLGVSCEIRDGLSFWLNNINAINGKVMLKK